MAVAEPMTADEFLAMDDPRRGWYADGSFPPKFDPDPPYRSPIS